MTIALRAEASRAIVVLDGVDRVAFNEDGSMELLTPAANPTGNKVMTVSQMPFSKKYVSPEQTITAAGLLTLAHGLTVGGGVAVEPELIRLTAICKTAELGYAVGDIVDLAMTANDASATAGYGVAVRSTTTSITIRVGNISFSAPINGTSGAGGGVLTPANWRIVVRAWA